MLTKKSRPLPAVSAGHFLFHSAVVVVTTHGATKTPVPHLLSQAVAADDVPQPDPTGSAGA